MTQARESRMEPAQSEPGGDKSTQNRPEEDGKATSDTDVPQCRQSHKKAGVGRQPPEKARDNEDSSEVVWISPAQGAPKKSRGKKNADEVDDEKHPGNLLGPRHRPRWARQMVDARQPGSEQRPNKTAGHRCTDRQRKLSRAHGDVR